MMIASLIFGGTIQASAQDTTPPPPDETVGPYHVEGKVTPADRKAAAANNKANGLLPGVAGLDPEAVGTAAMDPGGLPHYFGPYANYANSPMPTGAIASITVDYSGGGYDFTTNPPTVTISDAYGTGDGLATAEVDPVAGIDAFGGIAKINVTNAGSGYTAPIVTIEGDGSEDPAAASAVLDVTSLSGGIQKFIDAMPGLTPAGANLLGQYIPIAVADKTTFPGNAAWPEGSHYYEIGLIQYSEQLHSDLPPTLLRGYVQIETPAIAALDAVDPTVSKHFALVNVTGFDPVTGDEITELVKYPDGAQVYAVDEPHYLGPLLLAERDAPIRIKFTNFLPTGAGGNLFIPVDETVMGAGMGPKDQMGMDCDPMMAMPGMECQKYAQNRATLHLHGGFIPWISDGTPHQWTTPAGEDTQYPKGVSVEYVPDMWFDGNDVVPGTEGVTTTPPASNPTATNNPGDGSLTFYYNNQQSARLMFYHDHAYGITRLNVYAGEAAGYLLTDKVEQDLIDGTNLSGVNPGLVKVLPGVGIPLVVQDKTFVDATTIPAQDPTWNWGATPGTPRTGDLWVPSVYMPAQNPWDLSGASAFGRWQYGPWFWPPTSAIMHQPIPNEFYDPDCDASVGFCEPPFRPDVPTPSMGMEAFMDTAMVNGTVYPYLEVDPTTVRFRVLDAADDRFVNLHMYVAADKTAPTTPGTTGTVLCDTAYTGPVENCTEVKMVPALKTAGYPAKWSTDGREGGVPDPYTMGPSWVQIGNEAGFLPAPTVIQPQPINWNMNATAFNVGNVTDHSLLLGPAERADVLVDFTQYAGQTLILYNDAPAAFPALDPRYDYYTGSLSQVDTGGAPTTQPGFGPNTRTIMQIRVRAAAVNPSFEMTPAKMTELKTVFSKTANNPGVFASSQDAPIIPQAPYGSAYNTTYAADASVYVKQQDFSFNFFNGPLTGLILNKPGTGYTSAPTVTFTGGGGANAAASATIGGAYVNAVTVLTKGSGYTTAPTVSIAPPVAGGTPATATANLTRIVSSITILNGGTAYTSAPTVSFIGGGGSGATATATIAGGRVTAVTVTNGGSGYTTPPTVRFTGGGGRNASAVSVLTRVVGSITITNGGFGYAEAPAVTISGGGGSGATAAATFVSGYVSGLTLDNPGTGYTSAPKVTLTGGGGTGALASAKGINLDIEPKAIHDEMGAAYDEYGRMSGFLGLELPVVNSLNQNMVLYGYASPPIDLLQDSMTPLGTLGDGTQIWKITHNGVDTHPIHFHLFNVQLINRVAWDGALLLPEPNELGWKETVRVNPLEHTIVAMRPVAPQQPFDIPNSVRPLDPTMPIGAPLACGPGGCLDTTGEAAPVINHEVNFGWEYVWHCHILSHEEMDMMHSLSFAVAPNDPSGLSAAYFNSGPRRVTLAWTDNANNETNFVVQRATSPAGPWATRASNIPESAGVGGRVTYNDTTVLRNVTYYYRVLARNVIGDTTVYAAPAIGYPTKAVDSASIGISIVTQTGAVGTPMIFANSFDTGLTPPWTGAVGNVQAAPQAALGPDGGPQGLAAEMAPAGIQAQSVTDAQPAYVFDASPEAETTYNANFYFNPNGAIADSPVDIFSSLYILTEADLSSVPVFGVQYEHDSASADYEIRGWIMVNGEQIFTEWFEITNAAHNLEVAWISSTNGGFSLYVDDALVGTMMADTSLYKVDQVMLGPSAGLTAGASGTLFFDEFTSNRLAGLTYMIFLPSITQ